MKIPKSIRPRIPKIMSLLEAQCKEGEFLTLHKPHSVVVQRAGRYVERYSVYAESNGDDERYIAGLEIVRGKKGGRILEYHIGGGFSEK